MNYVVTGCADLDPPPNARVERYDDSIVVRCNLSHETWYLTCKGSVWIGTITNCSEGQASAIEHLTVALPIAEIYHAALCCLQGRINRGACNLTHRAIVLDYRISGLTD